MLSAKLLFASVRRSRVSRLNRCPVASAAAFLLALAAFALTGCGTVPVSGPKAAVHGYTGEVYGGQQPVTGARIQLYAVGTAGDGSAATSLMTQTVTTSDGTGSAADGNGNAGNGFNSYPMGAFNLVGYFTCPANNPGALTYMTATGGNPGYTTPTSNGALAMLVAVGPCNAIGSSTFLSVNEQTTVASIIALTPYMSSLTGIGSSPADAAQLSSAFTLVSEYVNLATGTVPGPGLPAGQYGASLEIATLADIMSTCINATDPSAPACTQLFQLTTPPSNNNTPADTVTAFANIVRYPANNTYAIYGLLPAKGRTSRHSPPRRPPGRRPLRPWPRHP